MRTVPRRADIATIRPLMLHRLCSTTAYTCVSRRCLHSLLPRGDTIFALSTAPGRAAIAVIRISGPDADSVLRALIAPKSLPPPRSLLARRIVDPITGRLIDRGMCVWLPAAAGTPTGEDCAELHVHGGRAVTAAALAALGCIARPAAAGEFTRRAFTNGKLDLVQVEALSDLLNADTDVQRRVAVTALDGAVSALYDGWRRELIAALASVEAVLDFSEEQDDVTGDVFGAVEQRVAAVAASIRGLLQSDGGRGELLRQGVNVVLTGAVNAGKSSLLNALARRPAAIVSATPGTTRDVIEVAMDLGGLPVFLVDTAGIRDGVADAVEEEGVRRARQRAASADIKVVVVDVRSGVAGVPQSVLQGVDSSTILVANKCDLLGEDDCVVVDIVQFNGPPPSSSSEYSGLPLSSAATDSPPSSMLAHNGPTSSSSRGMPPDLLALAAARGAVLLRVSCMSGDGLDTLQAALERAVQAKVWSGNSRGSTGTHDDSDGLDVRSVRGSVDDLIVSRARHRYHLAACAAALESFLLRPSIDMAAEELRLAVRELGSVVGTVNTEEMLDVLFASFCIGK